MAIIRWEHAKIMKSALHILPLELLLTTHDLPLKTAEQLKKYN